MTNPNVTPESAKTSIKYTTSGKTTIAPEVLLNITRLTTLNVPGVSRMSPIPGGVNRFLQRGGSEGVRLQVKDDVVTADLYLILAKDCNIRDVSRKVQHQVSRAITEMVGMHVGHVNIHIEDIDYSEEPEAED
jgi:uncharacterized alkaline shock family protein YloU